MKSHGFTLIEILVVIAIVGVLLSIGASVFRTLQTQNELAAAIQTIRLASNRAQILAQGSANDSGWGIKMSEGEIVVFQGSVFASRDQSFDQDYNVASNVRFSGLTEIAFNKQSGHINSPGTLTITSPSGVKNLSVNSKGILTY